MIKQTILSLLVCAPLALSANDSLKNDPAYLDIDAAFDLTEITPEVNVNLPRFLLLNTLADFDGGPDDPLKGTGLSLKDLVDDIKLIRVVVIGADDKHGDAIDRGLKKLKAELEESWTSIVSVPGENVHIYARSNNAGDRMAGIALVVADGGSVVLGNVVGEIPIGKILKIATKLKGDMIPAELLEQLAGLSNSKEEEVVKESNDPNQNKDS